MLIDRRFFQLIVKTPVLAQLFPSRLLFCCLLIPRYLKNSLQVFHGCLLQAFEAFGNVPDSEGYPLRKYGIRRPLQRGIVDHPKVTVERNFRCGSTGNMRNVCNRRGWTKFRHIWDSISNRFFFLCALHRKLNRCTILILCVNVQRMWISGRQLLGDLFLSMPLFQHNPKSDH